MDMNIYYMNQYLIQPFFLELTHMDFKTSTLTWFYLIHLKLSHPNFAITGIIDLRRKLEVDITQDHAFCTI